MQAITSSGDLAEENAYLGRPLPFITTLNPKPLPDNAGSCGSGTAIQAVTERIGVEVGV